MKIKNFTITTTSQVPFSGVNLGVPEMSASKQERKDAAMVCRIFLEEYNKGLGKGEQPIFPNIVFRLKKGVNFDEGDEFYDLRLLAEKVAARRMNPTFRNLDCADNLTWYEKGILAATMGCVDGDEVITYKIDGKLYVEKFESAYNRLLENRIEKEYGDTRYIDLDNVTILDSKNGFVKCKRILRNPDKGDWYKLTFDNGSEIIATSDHPLPVRNKGRMFVKDMVIGEICDAINGEKIIPTMLTKIEFLGRRDKESYDVTTESDFFDVSGIYSHNCRTDVMDNVNGPAGPAKRGNIAPVTINLPRIAILAKGDWNRFYRILGKRMELCKNILLTRYDVLKKLKVKDLPFTAGQKLIMGSENLSMEDSIEPILKNGTWGIGFIGLAETLFAMEGKHHGESDDVWVKGFNLIKHMRETTDEYKRELKLNFSLYATPKHMWAIK